MPIALRFVRRRGALASAAALAAALAATASAHAEPGDAGAEGVSPAPEVVVDTAVSASTESVDESAGEDAGAGAPEPLVASRDQVRPDQVELQGSVAMSRGSVRSQVAEWMIMPAGSSELGGTLSFVTSEPMLGDAPLRFTDVVLMQLRARTSVRGKVEVGAGVDLLPKQPSYLDESVWQGAQLAAKVGLRSRLAIAAAVSAGPLLDGDGHWGGADLELLWRKPMHETVWFQLGAGAGATALRGDAAGDFWMAEASARGQTILRAPNGMAGVWTGIDFRVPVAHGDGRFDPHTRANFHLGALYAVVDDLDLFVELAIVDRGDPGEPATMLPILSGGFDQRHLLFGVVHRFADERSTRAPTYLAY